MNFQFNTVVLKEKRRGYSYCKNNDKFDIVKNLAKPRKAKVLRMPEKWPINILSLLRKENWGVQKVNAGIARSCRLGHKARFFVVIFSIFNRVFVYSL